MDGYSVSFCNKDDTEIGRKHYKGSYGGMINNARLRGKRIGASYFWHKIYVRKFNIEDEED